MKWLFILLLLGNVLYLGWELDRETDIAVRNRPSAVSIPRTAGRLQLISEMEALPGARTTAIDSGPGIPEMMEPEMDLTTTEELVAELPEILVDDTDEMVSRKACYRYGPIPDENMIKGLYDWFRSRGVQARIQYTEEQSRQMFWVYLTPPQSRESALALMKEMQDKGIGDYRLISRGDMRNAISLGLYSSRDAVNNRLRELNEKGYVPIVIPYTDVSKIFWLDIEVITSSVTTREMYRGFPSRYESVPVNCNDISRR